MEIKIQTPSQSLQDARVPSLLRTWVACTASSNTAERSTESKMERPLCSVTLAPYGLARMQPAGTTTQACCLTLKAMVCRVQCTYFSLYKLHTLNGSYIYVKNEADSDASLGRGSMLHGW